MNSQFGNVVLTALAGAVVIVIALLIHSFFVAPEQKKCEDQGGEVIKTGKTWHCETPIKVPAKTILPAEKL